MRPVAGPALVLVLTKLIENGQVECAKFLDAEDFKLNLKLYIEYKSAILDERIRMHKKKKMMTPRGTQPTIDAFKYLIIILPTSYKNNVLYYLSTHKTGFVIMPEKKKQEFCSKSTAQDV